MPCDSFYNRYSHVQSFGMSPTAHLGAWTRFRVMACPFWCSKLHSLNTLHSVGLLWLSDQPDAVTCTWKHTTLTRDRHPCSGGIPPRNPSKWVATDLYFTSPNLWDGPISNLENIIRACVHAQILNLLQWIVISVFCYDFWSTFSLSIMSEIIHFLVQYDF
jgi:hypothetical protein